MADIRPAQREIHTVVMDSDRWDDFRFRDGDIIIATWAKSGTTWTQQIVSQLLFNGEEGLAAMDLAPLIGKRAAIKVLRPELSANDETLVLEALLHEKGGKNA